MVEESGYAVALMLIGMAAAAGVAVRAGLERVGVPAVAGYVVMGVVLAAVDRSAGLLTDTARHGFELLARIGIVVLLFRIGLESNLETLVKQLRPATVIWLGNVTIAFTLGFAAVWAFSDYGFGPAVFAGVALSATSVGVSTAVWREMDALDTQEGALLLDVAELDDLSSVLFLSLLVAMAPTLGLGLAPGIGAVARQSGGVLAKLALFLTACTVFSRFIERPITAWAERLNRRRGPALVAAGMGLAIAGAGELLGLSLAIGALFAGLAFSRDPAEKQIDRSVEELDALFTPFFFIGVGLSVSPFALSHHLGFTSALLGAAILGKVLGGGGPALAVTTPGKAALIGASLTPRAEIALIVAGYGLALGGWAMPQGLHDALVVVSLATVLSAPVAIRSMLVRMNADLIRERRLA